MGYNRGFSYMATMTAGSKAVTLGMTLLAGIWKEMTGALDGDDEEATDFVTEGLKEFWNPEKENNIKRFLSEWYSKGHVAVLNVDKEGKLVTWADISHLIPQSDVTGTLQRFAAAITKADFLGDTDDSAAKAFRNVFVDILGPYFNKQIWIEALLGKDTRDPLVAGLDQRIITDSDYNRAKTIATAALPGIVPDAWKVYKAISRGKHMDRGRQITPTQEVLSAFLGQKVQTTDISDRLDRRMRFRGAELRDTTNGFRDALKGGTEQTVKKTLEETERMLLNQKESILRAHKDFKGAAFFMGQEEAEKILEESNLSSRVKNMILEGYYEPIPPSKSLIEDARAQDIKFGTEGNVEAALEYIDNYEIETFNEEEEN